MGPMKRKESDRPYLVRAVDRSGGRLPDPNLPFAQESPLERASDLRVRTSHHYVVNLPSEPVLFRPR